MTINLNEELVVLSELEMCKHLAGQLERAEYTEAFRDVVTWLAFNAPNPSGRSGIWPDYQQFWLLAQSAAMLTDKPMVVHHLPAHPSHYDGYRQYAERFGNFARECSDFNYLLWADYLVEQARALLFKHLPSPTRERLAAVTKMLSKAQQYGEGDPDPNRKARRKSVLVLLLVLQREYELAHLLHTEIEDLWLKLLVDDRGVMEPWLYEHRLQWLYVEFRRQSPTSQLVAHLLLRQRPQDDWLRELCLKATEQDDWWPDSRDLSLFDIRSGFTLPYTFG
jgi:hypothetical protein